LAASFLQALAIVLLFLRKYRGVLSRHPLPRINLLVLIPRRQDLENKHWTLISLKGHAFEGRSRDVSEDVAQEIRRRCDLLDHACRRRLRNLSNAHEGTRQLTLRLA
jgi:hypothetical protein